MGRGPSPRDGGSAPVLFSDKNPLPFHRLALVRRMGPPRPHPCPARPSSPTGPGGTHTSLAGSARPSTTRTFRSYGHGAQPQTFRPGERPVSETGPGREGVYMLRSEPGTLSESPGHLPGNAGSWTGGFRRRREDSDRERGASLPGLYR